MPYPLPLLTFFGLAAASFVACSSLSNPPHPTPSSAPEPIVTPLESPPVEPKAEPAPAPESASPGRKLGRYQLTYYWVADEADAEGAKSVALRDQKCKTIARVSSRFKKALHREGTGRLTDGRIVNISGGCKCGTRCFLVAPEDKPYGLGVRGRPLAPFRSIAAPKHIKVGTVLYLPELDGLVIPGSSKLGGSVHNGCVVADDRGGGVTGRQLDLFTGRRTTQKAFFRRHKINRVSVHRAGDRCSDLEAPGVRRSGEG